MPKRNIANKYVSSSHSVDKDVKNFVKGLRWVHVGVGQGQHTSSRPSTSSSSCNTSTGIAKKTQSKAWDFMGRLVKEDGSDFTTNVYCKYCLIR